MTSILLRLIESRKVGLFIEGMRHRIHYFTLASLYVLSLSSFVSISVMALSHLLIAPSIIYFSIIALRDGRFSLPKSSVALVALFTCSVISVFYNFDEIKDPFYSFRSLKYFIVGALSVIPYYYLVKDALLSDKHLKRLLNIFLFTVIGAHLSGLISLYFGYNHLRQKPVHPERAMGLFGNIMTYGYETSLLVVLLTGIALIRNKIYRLCNRYLFWGALITSYIGLYFSYTRGAMLGVLLSVPVLLYFLKRKVFYVGSLITLGLVGLMVTMSLLGGNKESRYLLSINNESNTIRWAQFRAATMMFFEEPLFGIGFREFANKSSKYKKSHGIKYSKFQSHTHNNYLEVLTSAGILAFVAFCFWIYFWSEDLLFYLGKSGWVVFSMVFSFLVSGFFQSTIIDGENMFFLMNVFALSTALVVIKKESFQSTK